MKTNEKVLTELGVTKEQVEKIYDKVLMYKSLSKDTLEVLQAINNDMSGNDRAVAFYIFGSMRCMDNL